MKILLVQHRAIGDVIMCTPAIRALKRAIPKAEITFLVSDYAFDVLRYNPHIDRYLVPPKNVSNFKYMGYLYKVKKNRYDIVIDFQNNPRSALVTFISCAKKRISFDSKHRNYAYNIQIQPPAIHVYAAIRKLMLLQPLGIEEMMDVVPDFYIAGADREWADQLWKKLEFSKEDLVIVVSPVSGGRKFYRQWNPEHYGRLCDFLISKYNAKILFNWGPGEYRILKSVLEQMKNRIEIDYEISNIRYLKAVLEKSSLYIGCDGGARHMAIAADIPTIGLYHNSRISSHWTPPGDPKHVIIQPEKVGIKNIQLETVIKITDTIVGSIPEKMD